MEEAVRGERFGVTNVLLGAYILYTHMMTQRRKVLAGEKVKKVQ